MNHDCIEGVCQHGVTDAGEVIPREYETNDEFWARVDKECRRRELAGKYVLYLIRWQLSTPILALVMAWLGSFGAIVAAITANLIGGLIFFWIDRLIFKEK